MFWIRLELVEGCIILYLKFLFYRDEQPQIKFEAIFCFGPILIGH